MKIVRHTMCLVNNFKNTAARTLLFFARDPAAGEGEEAGAAATKTCLDTTLISRRVARARTHARNANTNTKHDFPVGGVTKDSPPQPPTLCMQRYIMYLHPVYAQILLLVPFFLVHFVRFFFITRTSGIRLG